MNAGFAKLFGSIVTSSIWVADNATLRVWIAMLATADAEGVVQGSVPGFASLARVTIDEMEAALEKLSAPDPHSRTKDHDGRRIEPVDGGWLILNYLAYRSRGQGKDGSRAPYYRDYRKKRRGSEAPQLQQEAREEPETPAERNTAQHETQQPQHKDVARNTEAEAEAEGERKPACLPPLPPQADGQAEDTALASQPAGAEPSTPEPAAESPPAPYGGPLTPVPPRLDPATCRHPALAGKTPTPHRTPVCPDCHAEVRLAGEPDVVAKLRAQVAAAIRARAEATGEAAELVLHRASRTSSGSSITDLDACSSMPWLTVTLDKLRQWDLQDRATRAGQSPAEAVEAQRAALIPWPEPEPAAAAAWDTIRRAIEPQINPHSFAQWFRPLIGQVLTPSGGLVIRTPSATFCDWVTANYGSIIGVAALAAGVGVKRVDLRSSPLPDAWAAQPSGAGA